MDYVVIGMFLLYTAAMLIVGWLWAQEDVNYYRTIVYAYEQQITRKMFE